MLSFKKTGLLLLLLMYISQVLAQVQFMNPPLTGTEGTDYWIVNYVDHDTSAGIRNYQCGDKTYNGHQGTDFVIRSFKTMDSGIYVVAVANGRVFATRDNMFDRNKHHNSGQLGNYVGISSHGQYFTYYAHLKQYSLMVSIGDTVFAGQRLGKVACSGDCTDPHVHIEVWDSTNNIDPFSGPCAAASGLWVLQPFYDTSLRLIDKGFTPYVPNLDTLKERYLARDTFYTGIDTVVNYWLQVQGLRLGDSERVDWYTPGGALWYSFTYHNPTDWWYDYFWTYITMPSQTGVWTVKTYVNNSIFTSSPFFVTQPLTAVNQPNPTSAGEDFTISPNPTRDYLNISGGVAATDEVLIRNLVGKIVGKYPAGIKKIDVSGLSPGVYTISCGLVVRQWVKW